jgi:hypothetical protein
MIRSPFEGHGVAASQALSRKPQSFDVVARLHPPGSQFRGLTYIRADDVQVVRGGKDKDSGSEGDSSTAIEGSLAPSAARADAAYSALLGPFDCGFITVCLSQHAVLQLPRLVLTGHAGHRVTAEGVIDVLARIREVLDRRQPLTITWDTRHFSMPPMGAVRRAMDWVKVPENTALLDEYLQGIVIILTNPIIRSIANFVLGVLKPPQPLRVVATEEGALAFLRAKCQEVHRWAEPSAGADESLQSAERRRET